MSCACIFAQMAKLLRRLVICTRPTAFAVAMFLSGCSGGGGGDQVVDPPTGVAETVSVSVNASAVIHADGAFISVVVTASSNKGAVSSTCTVDGTPSACSGLLPASAGSHQVCATVTYVTASATKSACADVTIPQTVAMGKVVVLDLVQGELPPSAVRVRLFKGADRSGSAFLNRFWA